MYREEEAWVSCVLMLVILLDRSNFYHLPRGALGPKFFMKNRGWKICWELGDVASEAELGIQPIDPQKGTPFGTTLRN